MAANIIFLLGGARSGKSTYAEELAKSFSDRVAYIATAEIIDEEIKKRVLVHRERRPDTWVTYEFDNNLPSIEDYKNILSQIVNSSYKIVLIDCITILLFRLIHKYKLDEIETVSNNMEKVIEDEVKTFFENFLLVSKEYALKNDLKFIIVSNEVGLGVVPSYPLGRIFRDLMGTVNKEIAAVADEVHFFIAGIKQRIK
jgi:adenosylcobinamide kinase/adenosylcobinamide-phosphate guanylyltransferase